MPKLSVIVPVYNVEKYLHKCIDSILTQSFSDLELILVDDGSPDQCGDICDKYAEQDSRVTTIHQENAGVSAARNAGIKIAKGELLSFVDADDFLHPKMYEIMVAAITESDSDIGVCDFQTIREGERYANSGYAEQGYIQLSAKEYVEKLYSMPPTLYNSCWNKIFRRESILQVYDTRLAICEDAKFLVQNVETNSKICYVSSKLYYYLIRSGSATRTKASYFLKELEVRKEIGEIIKNRFPSIYPMAYELYVNRCLNVAGMQERGSEAERQALEYVNESMAGLKSVRGISTKKRFKYMFAYLGVIFCRRFL